MNILILILVPLIILAVPLYFLFHHIKNGGGSSHIHISFLEELLFRKEGEK
jgi:hypothetical protein